MVELLVAGGLMEEARAAVVELEAMLRKDRPRMTTEQFQKLDELRRRLAR
jgi:hypothetical protein